MKRTLGTFLLVLGMMLAQCVSASAATELGDFYEALSVGNKTIKLENDITYNGVMEVAVPLTIDLNGYVLTIPNGIKVEKDGNLTIADSNPDKEHKFTPNSDGLWELDENDGTKTVNGGIITGGTGTPDGTYGDCGGGIFISDSAALIMNGGSIVGCQVTNNRVPKGGGVYISNANASFTMNAGAHIIGCRACQGGGVMVMGGQFTMNGGSIENCIVESDDYSGSGGGVYIDDYGNFTMEDGEIKNCRTKSTGVTAGGGGGVRIEVSCTFEMKGGKITDCTAQQSQLADARGGGVWNGSGGSFIMSGDACIENCKDSTGSGVYNGGRTFTIRDNAKVTNNVRNQSTINADGGTIEGEVMNESDGWSKIVGADTDSTKFNGKVTNNGSIEKGTFTGEVINNSSGIITGGTFTGTVTNNEGTITGGDFSQATLKGTLIITFDPDTGEENSTQKVAWSQEGAKLTAPTPAPTRVGYTLGSWCYKVNETKKKWDFDTDKAKYTMTLTANWKANAYTVTVENDGNGSASASSATATMGEEVTLTATPNSGYHFKKWEVISGGVTINDNKFIMPAENVTVKAIFERNASGSSGGGTTYYTLTFDTNGGGSINTVRKARGKTIDLSAYTPTRDGYAFSGWYADAALTDKITEIKLNGNKTVYAGWTKSEPKTEKNPFADVRVGDWFYRDVLFGYEKGLMSGIDAAAFAPYANTTRAQIAVIFYRMEGSPAVEGENSFTDVVPDMAWLYDAVTWAQQNGIMGGCGNNRFAPNEPVTREQLVAIFYRYAQYKGYDTTQDGMAIREFDDYESISDYAMGAMTWAVNSGLVKGGNNLLNPKGTAARAEIAAMLHRFMESRNENQQG